MPRGIALTHVEIEAMKRMRRANPRMPYREIGDIFGVTNACVCHIVSGIRHSKNSKPPPDSKPPKVSGPNPQPKDSFIRALTPAELMAGNGRICRSRAA